LQAYSPEPLGKAREAKFRVRLYTYLCVHICHIYKHRQKEFIQRRLKEASALTVFCYKSCKNFLVTFSPEQMPSAYRSGGVRSNVDSDFLILVRA